MFGRGCAVAEARFRRTVGRLRGKSFADACQTPHLFAVTNGQHIHSVWESRRG